MSNAQLSEGSWYDDLMTQKIGVWVTYGKVKTCKSYLCNLVSYSTTQKCMGYWKMWLNGVNKALKWLRPSSKKVNSAAN